MMKMMHLPAIGELCHGAVWRRLREYERRIRWVVAGRELRLEWRAMQLLISWYCIKDSVLSI